MSSYFSSISVGKTKHSGVRITSENTPTQIQKKKEKAFWGGEITQYRNTIVVNLRQNVERLRALAVKLTEGSEKFYFFAGAPENFGSPKEDPDTLFWKNEFQIGDKMPLGLRKVLLKDKTVELSPGEITEYFRYFKATILKEFPALQGGKLLIWMLSIQGFERHNILARGSQKVNLLYAAISDRSVCEIFQAHRRDADGLESLIKDLRKHPGLVFDDSDVAALINNSASYHQLEAFMNVLELSLKGKDGFVRDPHLARTDLITCITIARKLRVAFDGYDLDDKAVKAAVEASQHLAEDMGMRRAPVSAPAGYVPPPSLGGKALKDREPRSSAAEKKAALLRKIAAAEREMKALESDDDEELRTLAKRAEELEKRVQARRVQVEGRPKEKVTPVVRTSPAPSPIRPSGASKIAGLLDSKSPRHADASPKLETKIPDTITFKGNEVKLTIQDSLKLSETALASIFSIYDQSSTDAQYFTEDGSPADASDFYARLALTKTGGYLTARKRK